MRNKHDCSQVRVAHEKKGSVVVFEDGRTEFFGGQNLHSAAMIGKDVRNAIVANKKLIENRKMMKKGPIGVAKYNCIKYIMPKHKPKAVGGSFGDVITKSAEDYHLCARGSV